MRLCVCVCMRTCTYVYLCNSGPPIARFEERRGSVVKSRAQSSVIGVL